MKLHLPLPLRTALLSAVVSFVGFSSVAQGEKICGHQSEAGKPASGEGNYTGYESLVVCHCGDGGIWTNSIDLSTNDYIYVYNNEDVSAINGNSLLIYDCNRVVFRNNQSLEDYTYDITGMSALAGGGAVSAGCEFSYINDLFFFGNQATMGVGGAIDSDGRAVYIHNCGKVIFSGNFAKLGGGAIGLYDHWKGWGGVHKNYLQISKNSKDVTFSDNKSGASGGAIAAKYVYIEWNKGSVLFSGNTAEEYGGAIHVQSCDAGVWQKSLYLHDNEEVVFRNNVAGIAGGAIYSSSGIGEIVITDNRRVLFENNVGGAIYTSESVCVNGNEDVIFKNNKVAIEAATISLSTTERKYSSLEVYDSIIAKSELHLNSTTPLYGVGGGVISGTIRFSGEQSVSHVVGQVTVGAGKVVLEKGATLRTDSSFSHKGGALSIGQYKDSGTVLDVASAYTFTADGGGTLTFDLDYNVDSAVSLVTVGGNLSVIDSCIRVDDSGLNGNPATIALLSVGNNIKYDGKTYTFSGGDWSYTSNNVRYTLPMEDILVSDTLKDGAALEWKDKTLYYTIADTGTWEGKVKGLDSGKTWRGDTLDWHDINKDFTIAGLEGDARYSTTDVYYCWVASAANMIQYWQDRYAPLFQSEELATARTDSQTAGDVYAQLRKALPKYDHSKYKGTSSAPWSSWANVACSWWFNTPSALVCNNRFNKINNSYSWNDLGFSDNNFVTYLLDSRVSSSSRSGIIIQSRLEANTSLDEFCKLLDEVFQSDSAVGLGWVKTEKSTGKTSRHAITMWSARREGNQCIIEYTDSDTETGATSEMILEEDPNIGVHVVSYYDGKDQVKANGTHDMVIYAMHTIVSPPGMDELLESYNNTKTLHWTGTAEGSRWKASSHTIGGMRHLADSTDGWKKECKGGGRTIYAHAYFTKDNAQQMDFIFDSQVGTSGTSVSNRVVRIEDDIKVNNVSVKSEYHFAGNGTLNANQLEVEGFLTIGDFNGIFGTDAELLSGNVKISNTPIVIGGTLKLDNFERKGATLTDGCAVTLEGGTLWCGGIKLVRAAELGDVTIGRYDYNAAEANMQMQACTVTGSGTFGCVIDMDGNVLDYANWALGSTAELNERFFYYIVSNNTSVAGDAGNYHFEYELTNAAIESNVDTIKEVPLRLSAASLSISDPDGLLTIGSAGVMNAESAADITICEAKGATVNAGETVLMTVPAEEVYLTQETNITAPELTVAEESTLTNEGGIAGNLVVEAFGMLAGSGSFGGTTVYDSGRLMVGSSPGAPRYESLTMKSGSELIFCLDGSTPASADKQGWGSGTHSVLHVTQPGGLVVENGTTVSVGCSLDFLNQSPLGERQTLSLVQLEAAGDAALLTALQSGTQFMLAEADDSLSSLTEVGAHVHHAQWEQGADNTLQLSFIVSSCPEDALIWTNAGGDGIWNETSQNWETLSGTASLFAAGRNVAFYQGGTVVLNDKVTVGDVVVSTAENLRWEGNGGIAGSGTLVKEGPGVLTLATDNSDFDGSVEIYGGRLSAAAATSLGSGTVVLDGGTLEIAANGIGNAIMNASDGTVEVVSGITHQLKETIYNVGNLKLIGRFEVGELEAVSSEQDKRVDVNGLVRKDGEGSGFLRTGDAEVTVAGNLGDPHTVDSSAAVMLYKEQTLEMDNGVGVLAGTVDYSQYLLTGNDRAAVSKIAEQAGAQLRSIEMNGGQLTVNADCEVLNATAGEIILQGRRLGGSIGGTASVSVSGKSELSGDNSYSGGTTLRDGAALTIGHENAPGSGIITNEGSGSIAVREGKCLTLHRAIANSGTLSLSGALDAGKLKLDIEVAGYVDAEGKATTGSGFVKAASYAVQLVEGGKTENAGTRVVHAGYLMRSELVLGADGVARAGGGVDYSRFYLTGDDAVSVSAVDAVSEAKGSDLLEVWMDSGALEVDADITVDADGGRISVTKDSTLGGTIDGVEIATAEGDYESDITAVIGGGSRVTVNGGHICLSGDNAYTGGTSINGGVLAAGSDTAFGAGDIVLNTGELNLNDKAAENALLANGGMIANGGAFRGSVSVNGSVGLRGNLSARSMSINSGSVLTLNGSTISVSGTLTLGGRAVLNLNGSDFGDGDVLITFGSLSGSEEMLTVDYGADSEQYSLTKEGNKLMLACLEETLPEEEPEEEPLPEPEPEPETPEPETPQPETPAPALDRESCDALVQSNWGVFTASHAFADAIGGQRSAAGYVGRDRSVAWVSALGGFHRIDASAGCSGSDIDLFGAAVGLEGILSAENTVGVAFGRLNGDVQLKQSGREPELEGTFVGVYGTHLLTDSLNYGLSLNWSTVYGDSRVKETIGEESLSLHQDSVQLNARLNGSVKLSQTWTLHAFAGAEYFASGSSETGEEQNVRLGSIQNLRGEIGIGTRYASGSTTVYGEVRYLNDMVRSNPYADINGLRGYGANPGRQGIGVTVGAQQSLGDGWSVNASYSLEAMSEATMHSANIGVGYRF